MVNIVEELRADQLLLGTEVEGECHRFQPADKRNTSGADVECRSACDRRS
jgi:hypothetical protein